MLSRNFFKWTLASLATVALGTVPTKPVLAHFPHHHFGHCFGGYGGGYSSYYSSFGYRPLRYGSYDSSYYVSPYSYSSYRFSPWCFSPRVISYNYYSPVVALPVSSYYYAAPTYYVEPQCVPTWGSLNIDIGVPFASTRGPSDFLANGSSVATARAGSTVSFVKKNDSRVAALAKAKTVSSQETSKAKIAKEKEIDSAAMYVAAKPRVLQPYSPIWSNAAMGIVDDMVQQGRFGDAKSSCESMEKIEQPMGAGVYLRQGLIKYFATKDHSIDSTECVLTLLDQACAAGSLLEPKELESESLRSYFAACSIDLKSTLEQLSKRVLDNPEQSEREMLLLTVLLKLEGQTDRAHLFANEAASLASKSTSFRWDSLLVACQN